MSQARFGKQTLSNRGISSTNPPRLLGKHQILPGEHALSSPLSQQIPESINLQPCDEPDCPGAVLKDRSHHPGTVAPSSSLLQPGPSPGQLLPSLAHPRHGKAAAGSWAGVWAGCPTAEGRRAGEFPWAGEFPLQENFPGLCSSLTPLMHLSLGEVLLLGMMNWEQQVLDEWGGQGYLGWPRACSSSLKAGSGGPAGPGDVARSEQGLNPHTPGHGLTVVTQIPSPLSQPARYPHAGSRADR